MSDIDCEPAPLGSMNTEGLLRILEPHSYQLSHDGYLQFGLLSDGHEEFAEIFVAPTKHLKVWFSDARAFLDVMRKHGLSEVAQLSFIDEFPRTTTPIASDKVAFDSYEQLIEHLAEQLEPPPS